MFRRLLNSCIILVLMLAALIPPSRGVQAQEPLPIIEVNLDRNWVTGQNLDLDVVNVTMEVFDPGLSEPICAGYFEPSPGEHPMLDCSADGINPGNQVLLYIDGQLYKEHTVIGLTLNDYDYADYFLSGTGPPDRSGWVYICNPGGDCFSHGYIVDEYGDWKINFNATDILPDAWFSASMADEDQDRTMVEIIPPPFPTFEIQPDHGWVCTGNWGIGVPITLTIDGSPISTFYHQEEKYTVQAESDPSVGEVCFDLYELAEEIQPGMYASMTDGNTIKETWIADIVFNSVGQDLIASGTGPDRQDGHVCLGFGEDMFCEEFAVSTTGDWFAYFGQYDHVLDNLTEGHVVIRDVDGDATRADLYFEPVPYIEARLPADALAIDLGASVFSVHLKVFSPDDPEPKCERLFDDIQGETEVLLDCWDGYIFPGDIIKLYVNGEVDPSKVHEVIDITLDVFDPDSGIFSGTLFDEVPAWVTYCNPDPPIDGCFEVDIQLGTTSGWEIDLGPGAVSPDAWFAAFAADEDGDLTMASLTPTPYISFSTTYNWLDINHFPPDSPVVVEIFTDDTEEDLVLTETLYTDGYGQVGWDVMTELFPGNYIISSNVEEQITRELAVENFSFWFIDYEFDQAGGSADEETQVNFGIMGPDLYHEGFVFAGSDGWMIDFWPDYGIDLTEDMDLWVYIVDDDGDEIRAEFSIPEPPQGPQIDVFVTNDWVAAFNLPQDSESASLEVYTYGETEPKCADSFTLPVEEAINLECWAQGVDILPGDQVMLFVDDDPNPIKTHTVFDLTLDAADLGSGYFAGTAQEGASVRVDVYYPDDFFSAEITIETGIYWEINFGPLPDDLEVWFEAVMVDEDGDQTIADFLPIQPAFLNVNLTAELIHAIGWPYGEIITLEIDDPSTTQPIDYSTEGTVEGYTSYDPNLTLLDFDAANYGLMPGFLVRIYNENLLKEHTVTGLIIDEVNYEIWSVSGSTESNSPVDVIGVGPDSEYYPLMSDQDGYWMADFNQALENFELIIISNWDQDGDATQRVIFPSTSINPSINVNLTENIISALDWPLESFLTLEIDDPQTSDPVDFSSQGTVTGYSPYDDGQTLFEFDTTSYEVLSGYAVKVYDSVYTKEHLVTDLTIDSVIVSQNQAVGSTGQFAAVNVLAIGSEFEFQNVESDEDGNWTANFSLDLSTALAVIAWEGDGDGDTTQRLWFPNSQPVAENDSYEIDEDTVLSPGITGGVLFNDHDPEYDTLTATLISGVQNGSLEFNPDGSFIYTPNQDYCCTESFSYQVNDGELDSNIAMVYITINPVNDVPEVSLAPAFSIDEGQSFLGFGSFSDPDQDVWSATVDYFSSDPEIPPVNLEIADKNFDLSYDYPADDGTYEISVLISDGFAEGTASTVITINNVAPNVDITSVAGGKDTVLTGLELVLVASFSDPGVDTHTAVIDWGDGSQAVDPALSPVTVSHVYQAAGIYPITVIVTDKDGGAGSAAVSLTVVDPAEAAQAAIDELDAILEEPDLDPDVAASIEDAIVELEGANDGASSSGALDKIDGGQWNAALVKIAKAIQDLEEAEDSDPALDFSGIKEALALTAKSVAVDVIELAEAITSSPEDLAKIQQAYELITQGQALLDSGDYLGAVEKFQEAVQVV